MEVILYNRQLHPIAKTEFGGSEAAVYLTDIIVWKAADGHRRFFLKQGDKFVEASAAIVENVALIQ